MNSNGSVDGQNFSPMTATYTPTHEGDEKIVWNVLSFSRVDPAEGRYLKMGNVVMDFAEFKNGGQIFFFESANQLAPSIVLAIQTLFIHENDKSPVTALHEIQSQFVVSLSFDFAVDGSNGAFMQYCCSVVLRGERLAASTNFTSKSKDEAKHSAACILLHGLMQLNIFNISFKRKPMVAPKLVITSSYVGRRRRPWIRTRKRSNFFNVTGSKWNGLSPSSAKLTPTTDGNANVNSEPFFDLHRSQQFNINVGNVSLSINSFPVPDLKASSSDAENGLLHSLPDAPQSAVMKTQNACYDRTTHQSTMIPVNVEQATQLSEANFVNDYCVRAPILPAVLPQLKTAGLAEPVSYTLGDNDVGIIQLQILSNETFFLQNSQREHIP